MKRLNVIPRILRAKGCSCQICNRNLSCRWSIEQSELERRTNLQTERTAVTNAEKPCDFLLGAILASVLFKNRIRNPQNLREAMSRVTCIPSFDRLVASCFCCSARACGFLRCSFFGHRRYLFLRLTLFSHTKVWANSIRTHFGVGDSEFKCPNELNQAVLSRTPRSSKIPHPKSSPSDLHPLPRLIRKLSRAVTSHPPAPRHSARFGIDSTAIPLHIARP